MNIHKHGISFEVAKTVFDDTFAVFLHDEAHSDDEDRFNIVGLDMYYHELTVCHCYRALDLIRIISARKATKQETEIYWEGLE